MHIYIWHILKPPALEMGVTIEHVQGLFGKQVSNTCSRRLNYPRSLLLKTCRKFYINIYEMCFEPLSLSYTFESVSLFLPQPRLCILALLCTKIRFLATYVIKCASWTAVNRGTSGRSACASIGHEGFASVDNSNTMASRNLWFTTI